MAQVVQDRMNETDRMQIAVCDDEKAVREVLKDKIEKACREAGMACQVKCYCSGEELLSAEDMPDLLFLDIQMPGIDGMDAAAQLRRRQWDTILIFVTALSEYVYDAFDVGAFHYLVKPFRDEKLREILIRAAEQYKKQRQRACREERGHSGNAEVQYPETADTERYGTGTAVPHAIPAQTSGQGFQGVILVKRGGISTAVPVESIIYAEVFNRKVTLHTTNGTLEYYGKLTDLSQQVGDHFYRTHRAYLVNLKYVEKYDAATIWLEQGKALVSKKQFAGFVKQYMRYIGGRG